MAQEMFTQVEKLILKYNINRLNNCDSHVICPPQVQNAFDAASCHFLTVNSRLGGEAGEAEATLADHWLGFSHRWCSVETRRGRSFTSGMATTTATNSSSNSSSASPPPSDELLPHPLAQPALPDSPAHVPSAAPKLTHVSQYWLSKYCFQKYFS